MESVNTKSLSRFGSDVQESPAIVPKDERLQVKSVKELGFNLPIGHIENGNFVRGFTLGEYGWEQESELAMFRRLNEGASNTQIVTKVLSLCVKSLGGQSLVPSEITQPEEREAAAMIKIGQLFMADVYYLWIRLRIEELGDQYRAPFICMHCRKQGELLTDIQTMDVYTVKDPSILQRKVPLSKGILWRNGIVKKNVTLTPIHWIDVSGPDMGEIFADEVALKLHFIKHAITGAEGIDEAVVISEPELRSLRKIDIETLAEVVNHTNLGPSMTLFGSCTNPECRKPFTWPLDWDYDNFFSTSSL